MTRIDDSLAVVVGDARTRGLVLAELGASHRHAVCERAQEARAFVDPSMEWVERQWQAQRMYLPDVIGVVEGMAEGFGLPVETLFAAHLRYAVEDRIRAGRGGDAEGCSTFAIRRPSGVLLAKNRDNRAYFRPLQQLVRQRDPAWGGREILCVGSVGSMPSASSGINSDGFCLADTAVHTSDLGIGMLRYYLMEALLIRCSTIKEALAITNSLPSIGGGNLIMADRSGEAVVVELGATWITFEHARAGRSIACTNHFVGAKLAEKLLEAPGTAGRDNSESRLDHLYAALGDDVADWTVERCQALLSEHDDRHGHAALCRHSDDVSTNSGAVYDVAAGTLHLSRGNPCAGDWRATTLI